MRVRQITAIREDGFKTSIRYDRLEKLLYRQNRSYDKTITNDEFLTMLKHTRKQAKKQGYSLIEKMGIKI